MENEKMCLICQDFVVKIGHDTNLCPNILCQKCGQRGHIKIQCMAGWENMPFPNEIIVKILSYLSLKDLNQCAQVSKRLRNICQNKMILKYLVQFQEQEEKKGAKIITQQLVLLLHAHRCSRKDQDTLNRGELVQPVSILI